MTKLKEKFSGIKNHVSVAMKDTPKRVQWLLLAAAFVVVLILLTLLFGGGQKKANQNEVEKTVAEIKINPDLVNWAEVLVGDKKSQDVAITATSAVNVLAVNNYTEIKGLEVKQNCTQIKQINNKIGCKIFLTYAPTAVQPVTNVSLFVEWHDASEPETMKKESRIVLTLGAQAPVVEPVQIPIAPTPMPEIKQEPVYDEYDDIVYEEPEPAYYEPDSYEPEYEPTSIQQEVKRTVETLAPADPFATKKNKTKKQEEKIVISDGCSDFAFPAYGTTGKQIGWVKPSAGAYYYHPFSDKDCTNPAGTYNPDNGIITDDNGRKLGTDAEHMGVSVINSGILPELSNIRPAIKEVVRAQQVETPISSSPMSGRLSSGLSVVKPAEEIETEIYLGSGSPLKPSVPYDRQFILRQYKPIPATIVSEIRADPEALENSFLPVRATVDRNVYSDTGRNVIIPAGTLMLGYVTGKIPGPYAAIGRMSIQWYQFILPNGMEYNFNGKNDPFSGDAQGREGVLGRGSTDYLEQFFMPMLTSMVPAAINLINPVADAFVNQIDLDNNTVVQSGTMRSSELAKNEIITAWNQVAQKLMLDMLDNSVPPFTIAAGTRITVYSPVDLVASCGKDGSGKKCSLGYDTKPQRNTQKHMPEYDYADGSWVGQSRSFDAEKHCTRDQNGLWRVSDTCTGNRCEGYSYSTLKFWCESLNYESKKAAQYNIYREDQQQQYQNKIDNMTTQEFNTEILGVQYNPDGTVQNPYEKPATAVVEAEETVLTCMDGSLPDANGCCAGEIYTDMGEMGFNCCPETGGDCFPPLL